jgi:hypothetical protein
MYSCNAIRERSEKSCMQFTILKATLAKMSLERRMLLEEFSSWPEAFGWLICQSDVYIIYLFPYIGDISFRVVSRDL